MYEKGPVSKGGFIILLRLDSLRNFKAVFTITTN